MVGKYPSQTKKWSAPDVPPTAQALRKGTISPMASEYYLGTGVIGGNRIEDADSDHGRLDLYGMYFY